MPAFPDFQSTTIDLVLPYDEPAGQMQYLKAISWLISVFGLELNQTVKGRWEIKIISPAGDLMFWQSVNIRVYMYNLGFEYVWYGGPEEIKTYVVDGNNTDKHPTEPDVTNFSWKHTLGGTELSEFGTLMQGGGSGFALGQFPIIDDWMSPVYLFKENPIPVGSRLVIVIDGWSGGHNRKNQYRFRSKKGVPEEHISTAKDSLVEMLYIARALRGFVFTSTNTYPHGQEDEGFAIKDAKSPSLMDGRHGRTYLAVLEGKLNERSFVEYVSQDSLGTAVRGNSDNGGYRIWEGEVLQPLEILTRSGIRLAFRVYENSVVMKTSEDLFSSENIIIKGVVPNSYSVNEDSAGWLWLNMIVAGTERKERVFSSDNGGSTWSDTETILPVA